MTIECYDSECRWHVCNNSSSDEGPFCNYNICLKKLEESLKEHNEFVCLEDGFTYYFPRREGAISAEELRGIAILLDEHNAKWLEELKDYEEAHMCPTCDGEGQIVEGGISLNEEFNVNRIECPDCKENSDD